MFPRLGNISVGICVSWVEGKHITRDVCFLGKGTHITTGTCMCFLGRETHITSYMFFLGMCFPGWGTYQ